MIRADIKPGPASALLLSLCWLTEPVSAQALVTGSQAWPESLVTRAPGLGRNIYESRALGWPGALFVHIVNIKFHRTFAFTVGHICSVDNKSHETGPP